MEGIGEIRLYRGLRRRYRPELVGNGQPGPFVQTNFTDCPYAALQFARSPRGSVLIVDVPVAEMEQKHRVSEELWSLAPGSPRRFLLWGSFDDLLVAEVARTLNDPGMDEVEEELAELGLLQWCRPALDRSWGKDEG